MQVQAEQDGNAIFALDVDEETRRRVVEIQAVDSSLERQMTSTVEAIPNVYESVAVPRHDSKMCGSRIFPFPQNDSSESMDLVCLTRPRMRQGLPCPSPAQH